MKLFAWLILLVMVATTSWVHAQGSAQPAPTPPPSAQPSGDLPPGHPPAAPPPGHGDAQPGRTAERLPDRVVPDDKLAPGTIAVIILDADDRPVPNIPITLAVLFSSVTKGDSSDQVSATTDENGIHIFENQKFGSGISYRVTTKNGPASFSSQPFGLTDQAGIRVLQHRFDAVTTVAESRLLFELHMVLDIKQDNVAINHLLVAVNLGSTAYVANDLRIPFPAEYEGFEAQESNTGVEMIERDNAMVLQGTFPPGQTQLTYRYQVPLHGGDELKVTLPTPPRVAAGRVVLKANDEMTLEVAGYGPSERGRWNDGAKVHEAQSRAPRTMEEIQAAFSKNDPGKLDITIKGIPTPGLKRTIAVLLALLAVGAGIFHVFRRREKKHEGAEPDVLEDLAQAKAKLLEELTLLEKLKNKGEVGPRTYEGLRTQLLDALARIMARLEEAQPTPSSNDDEPPKKRKRKKRRPKRAALAGN